MKNNDKQRRDRSPTRLCSSPNPPKTRPRHDSVKPPKSGGPHSTRQARLHQARTPSTHLHPRQGVASVTICPIVPRQPANSNPSPAQRGKTDGTLEREAYTEADVDTTYQGPYNPLQHTMSGHQRSVSQAGGPEKTYFEQQREVLIGEIAMVNKHPLALCRHVAFADASSQSFEHVLANINKLNRSLEAVTAVR